VVIKIADAFYIGGLPNVIVPVLLQYAEPLHLFFCSCSKLKLVSPPSPSSSKNALACCTGIILNPADSIDTAPMIPTISKVVFFI
jgi:hypothetical protein